MTQRCLVRCSTYVIRYRDVKAGGLAALPMKNRLRVLRAELNWSQADLGVRVGVCSQAINAVETGKFDPSLPLALKITRVFETRVEDVFELDAND